MMRRNVARIGILASAIVLAACITPFPVDKGRPIQFVNETGQRITLYDHGRALTRQYSGYRAHELDVDERYQNVWLDPGRDESDDRTKFRVEAVRGDGEIIFCHDFTMKEFTAVHWVVTITARDDCPPTADGR